MTLVPPRKLAPEIEDRLFAQLAAGKTLRAICRQPGMPSRETVYANRDTDPDFADRYAKARELGYDAMAEEVIDMVDDEPGRTKKGQVDNGHIAWQRLRMDARLKLLPKWDRRYKDATDVSLGNREGETFKAENPENIELTRRITEAVLEQARRKEKS